MSSCISANSKTNTSVDFTTDCPLRRQGKQCKYCYVESARNMNYNAKRVIDHATYKHEILGFTQARINKLNAMGGIRLFSFGDYMVEHKQDVALFLNDCHTKGLKVKVITKVIDFIHTFHNHPAISMIHISVDNTSDSPVSWEGAQGLRDYYSKVKIRAAIMKHEDVEALSFVDVMVFNHARNTKKYGFRLFTKKDIQSYAAIMPKKVCCQTGSCSTCPIHCLATTK